MMVLTSRESWEWTGTHTKSLWGACLNSDIVLIASDFEVDR